MAVTVAYYNYQTLIFPRDNASMVRMAQHFKCNDSECGYDQECLDANFN